MAKSKVIERDTGFRNFFNALKKDHRVVVDVGVFADSGQVSKAASHEFGVPGKLPQRSWLRSTFDENKPLLRREIRNIGFALVKSRTSKRKDLLELAEVFRKSVILRINKGIPGKPGGPVRYLRESGAFIRSIDAREDK